MKVMPRIYTKDSAGAAGKLVGEFVVPLATTIGPVLAAAVSAWFERCDGRKLRSKVGDIEVEAHSEEQLYFDFANPGSFGQLQQVTSIRKNASQGRNAPAVRAKKRTLTSGCLGTGRECRGE